ncbi:MAG TPA: GAF domain-containing protein, partial [Anaerolineae bacterium]|nr:GAF domain-containing protein [Anaerolineae bacterium]
ILNARLFEQIQRERQGSEELTRNLERERDTLETIMESTNAQIAYLDPKFNFVMVNSAYVTGSDHTKDELIGRNHFELFPNPENEAIFKKVRDTGKAIEFKAKPFEYADQPWRGVTYWDWILVPIKDTAGNVIGLVLSLVDVTESIRTRQLSDALNDINAAISSTFDANEIMQRVVSGGTKAIGAEAGVLHLREGDHWVAQHAYGLPREVIGTRFTDEQMKASVIAASTKKQVVSNDVYSDERVDWDTVEKYNIRSFLVVPLVVKENVTGVLMFSYHSAPVAFTDAQIDFARKLATLTSLTLERAQLHFSVQKELSRSKLLQDIAISATTNPDLRTIADEILKALNRHLNLQAGDIKTLDEKGQTLRLLASFGYRKATVKRIKGLPVERSDFLTAEAVRRRKLLTHEDDVLTPARTQALKEAGLENSRYMVTPVDYRGTIIGAFSLAFEGKRAFTKNELDLFHSIAHTIGQAIENARLFEAELEAQKQAKSALEVSNLLLKAADTLATSIDLHQVLESLADIVLEVTGRSRIVVNLIDEKTGELTVMMSRGEPVASVGTRFSLYDLVRPFTRSVLEKRTAIIDFESPEIPAATRKKVIEPLKVRLALFVPLILEGEVTGNIGIDTPGERREFTQRDIELVEAIASQAAVAIENARFHEKSVARARTLEAVGQMGSLITSTLSMRDALAQVIDYSKILLDVPSSLVLLLDQESEVFKVTASEGIPEDIMRKEITLDEATSLGFNRPMPALIDDLSVLSSIPFFAASGKEGFVSALVSPIFIEATLQGLIIIQDKQHLSPSEEDVAAFRLFTTQAATAIKNAERYEAERSIADTLQEALLTMPKVIPGVTFGYIYHSATETARVGGDFYDLFELEHGRIGIIIGDVSGKGLEAATLTALVKNTIGAYAYEYTSPAAVMAKTNDIVSNASSDSSFVTVFFGTLDKNTGDLIYCSAGHPPAVLERVNGDIEMLTVGSPAIGAFAGLRYIEDKATLRPGDILVLYTDGLTEARRNTEFFGEEGLVSSIKDIGVVPADDVARAIFNRVIDFTGGDLSDDVALLTVRLEGKYEV